jgi:hypothetical protein
VVFEYADDYLRNSEQRLNRMGAGIYDLMFDVLGDRADNGYQVAPERVCFRLEASDLSAMTLVPINCEDFPEDTLGSELPYILTLSPGGTPGASATYGGFPETSASVKLPYGLIKQPVTLILETVPWEAREPGVMLRARIYVTNDSNHRLQFLRAYLEQAQREMKPVRIAVGTIESQYVDYLEHGEAGLVEVVFPPDAKTLPLSLKDASYSDTLTLVDQHNQGHQLQVIFPCP